MEEIWKDVTNYEGLYQVSNLGRVKSLRVKKHLSEKAKERGGIPVVQYTKDGLFIKVWKYASFAGKTLGISPSAISACCLGKRKSIGGYTWKYLHDIKQQNNE